MFTHGPGQMFTKKPVRGIADVKGLEIRTGGGVAEAVANALGASAFVKPAPESYELLKSGVADGVFFPLESVVSFKLDTVLEQATIFPGGMYSSAFGFFMNEDTWSRDGHGLPRRRAVHDRGRRPPRDPDRVPCDYTVATQPHAMRSRTCRT